MAHYYVCLYLYLASDVWGHGWGRLGIDVCILGHKARIVGGDAAEAVGCNAAWWWRLVWQAATVATGGGGGWGRGVGLGASTPTTNTNTTTSPWGTGGTTVGTVDTAAGGGRAKRWRGAVEGWSGAGVRSLRGGWLPIQVERVWWQECLN